MRIENAPPDDESSLSLAGFENVWDVMKKKSTIIKSTGTPMEMM
jgi:hypothetical protein